MPGSSPESPLRPAFVLAAHRLLTDRALLPPIDTLLRQGRSFYDLSIIE
jgi:hypothetical protein